MVSANSTSVSVLAGSAIPWQNGNFTACDRSNSNSTTITLGRCGLYSIDFDGSVSTAAADSSISLTLFVNGVATTIGTLVATTAADSPVAASFNTVLRVSSVPTTISVVSDSEITVNKAQIKAVRL